HCRLDLADLLEVLIRAQGKVIAMREIAQRLGIRVGVELHVIDRREALAGDLFFEQRVHDDGAGAGVFEAPDHAQVVHQGGSAGHGRAIELQSEVVCGEIHGRSFSLMPLVAATPASPVWKVWEATQASQLQVSVPGPAPDRAHYAARCRAW